VGKVCLLHARDQFSSEPSASKRLLGEAAFDNAAVAGSDANKAAKHHRSVPDPSTSDAHPSS